MLNFFGSQNSSFLELHTVQEMENNDDQAVIGVESKTLFIVEIFRNVCAYLDSQGLARLAQCCKTFCDPAIRLLWDTISLQPLMESFPDDVIEIDPSECYVSTYRFFMLIAT